MWQLIILVAKEKVEGGSSLEEIGFSGCGCAPLAPGEIHHYSDWVSQPFLQQWKPG